MCHFRIFVLFLIAVSCTALAQSADSSKLKKPVAVVDGQNIYDEDLASSVQGQLMPLRNQEYEIKKKALDTMIEQKLLEKAAKDKNLTTEKLLAQEVGARVPEPTDSEVEAYYLAQKDRLNRPLSDVKAQLRQSLKQARAQQLRQDYIKSLRTGSNVTVLLAPPKKMRSGWKSISPRMRYSCLTLVRNRPRMLLASY